MKRQALALLLTATGFALAGCAGSSSDLTLTPPASFKTAQAMLLGGREFALVDLGYPKGVGVIPPYYIASVEVSRLPASTPVVVAKQWAEAAARGRTTAPLWGTTATLVRATATVGAGGGRTRMLLSNRTAWLVLMPFDQELTSPGAPAFAGTKAVLIDANSADYLEGALLPDPAGADPDLI